MTDCRHHPEIACSWCCPHNATCLSQRSCDAIEAEARRITWAIYAGPYESSGDAWTAAKVAAERPSLHGARTRVVSGIGRNPSRFYVQIGRED